jgi:DNA-binding protein HU-beta
MTKKELSAIVADKIGIKSEMVDEMLSVTADVIMKTVARGEPVIMRGFGAFRNIKRKAKIAQDITRGHSVNIPERNRPVFKAYPDFQNLVENKK